LQHQCFQQLAHWYHTTSSEAC